MAYLVHVTDPANAYHLKQQPHRTGWHYLFGTAPDCLEGSISRVMLTGVKTSVPSPNVVQDSDYCCLAGALSIALNVPTDRVAHLWLEKNGYITSAWGGRYEGVEAYLKTKGYSCDYDAKKYDKEMKGNPIYDKIINHLKKGYKVILCMHGIAKGGKSDFYTQAGHYIVLDGIKSNDQIEVDGYWNMATTTLAQQTFGTTVDGYVSNQMTKDKIRLPFCYTPSWKFKDSKITGGSELIRAIQIKIGCKNINGLMDRATVRAFRKWLGKPELPASISKSVVKAFQKWLNNQAK